MEKVILVSVGEENKKQIIRKQKRECRYGGGGKKRKNNVILGSQLEKTTKTKKQTAKNKLITKEDNMREREREREREKGHT